MNFTWTSNDPWVKSWEKLKGLNLTVYQSRIANKRINNSTLKSSCFTIALLTQMTLDYHFPRNWIFKVVYKKFCCLNSVKWFVFWQLFVYDWRLAINLQYFYIHMQILILPISIMRFISIWYGLKWQFWIKHVFYSTIINTNMVKFSRHMEYIILLQDGTNEMPITVSHKNCYTKTWIDVLNYRVVKVF